jgi:hypothetical protein
MLCICLKCAESLDQQEDDRRTDDTSNMSSNPDDILSHVRIRLTRRDEMNTKINDYRTQLVQCHEVSVESYQQNIKEKNEDP